MQQSGYPYHIPMQQNAPPMNDPSVIYSPQGTPQNTQNYQMSPHPGQGSEIGMSSVQMEELIRNARSSISSIVKANVELNSTNTDSNEVVPQQNAPVSETANTNIPAKYQGKNELKKVSLLLLRLFSFIVRLLRFHNPNPQILKTKVRQTIQMN